MDKPVTLVISDLHMGGGKADPGDDFIYQYGHFEKFIRDQLATAEGRDGKIELIINGDLLEFAQVEPWSYKLKSSTHWCSQTESVNKLLAILEGHPEVFDALREFQDRQNTVTLFGGNHDVDLYWPDVQTNLRRKAGNVAVELGEIWYSRYGGKLRISHGHMSDPANKFKNWKSPVLSHQGIARLEMCPGTLFMVHFVNQLETQYPFADNLHPVTRLCDVFLKENRYGFVTMGWLFSRFMARHPIATAGIKPDLPAGARILEVIQTDRTFLKKIGELYKRIYAPSELSLEQVRKTLNSEDKIEQFLLDLLAHVPAEEWMPILDQAGPATVSIHEPGSTLSILHSNFKDSREVCRDDARQQWASGAQVVTIGHTHISDELHENGRSYFNTGSWTRYLSAKSVPLKLDDLKNETKFPYKLLCLRVEQSSTGTLGTQMIRVAEDPGSFPSAVVSSSAPK